MPARQVLGPAAHAVGLEAFRWNSELGADIYVGHGWHKTLGIEIYTVAYGADDRCTRDTAASPYYNMDANQFLQAIATSSELPAESNWAPILG